MNLRKGCWRLALVSYLPAFAIGAFWLLVRIIVTVVLCRERTVRTVATVPQMVQMAKTNQEGTASGLQGE